MLSVRSSRDVLALAATLLLVGTVACANRGMEAPSDVAGSGGDAGASPTDAGEDHPASTGGAAGQSATGGAGGAAGAGGANARGGAGGGNASGGTGVAGSGGVGGGSGGIGGSAGGSGGAGGRGGTNAGGNGGASTGGTGGAGAGGAGAGGAGGQSNTGGAGAGGAGGQSNTGGAGAAGAAGTGAGGSAGAGGAGGANNGGAGGQALPPLFAYYPFDETAGPTIADASGNGHAGTLVGTGSFGAGVIGNALSIPGVTGDYVALPSALLQSVTNVTITLWVNVRTDHTWQRIFDLGSSSNVYMFLTPHASTGNVARFAISTGGINSEQRLDAPAVLPLGTWTHIAIVLGTGGTLYLNGASVATNANLTLRPSSLGATTNDWLGRSQFTTDPAFDGQIDDLRIYASALTAAQVTAIFNAR